MPGFRWAYLVLLRALRGQQSAHLLGPRLGGLEHHIDAEAHEFRKRRALVDILQLAQKAARSLHLTQAQVAVVDVPCFRRRRLAGWMRAFRQRRSRWGVQGCEGRRWSGLRVCS